MKYAFIAFALAYMFAGPPPDRSDFSGAWKLDLEKSVNLPASFKSVEGYTMTITQTSDSMTVVIALSGGGQSVKFPPTKYAFDSSEVFREDTLRHSKRWMRCSWLSTGKKMVVTSKVEQRQGGTPVSYTERDVWLLSDRSTMEIAVVQQYADHDSTRSEKRIFRRMK